MRSRAGIFWHSLFLTLLLLLPMAAAVIFLTAQRSRQNALRQAAAVRTGVQVEPGAQNTHRLLLVVQQEEPGFVLVRADAPAGQVTLCGLPGTLLVQAPAGTTTLAECALSAGAGRAAQLLAATAATGETALSEPDYLAASPACWALCLGDAAARIDPAALPGGHGGDVLNADAANAAETIAALQKGLDAADAAALRAAVWSAFARQSPEILAALPDTLRENSARTLTSLRAQDLAELGDTLSYLAAQPALTVDYVTAPTAPADGGLALTADGMDTVRALMA